MPEMRTYNDIIIKVIRQTPKPGEVVQLACDVTQKAELLSPTSITSTLCKYLLDAEHTSVFEHASITLLIQGVSRSWLAQTTRQRMSSPTSGSQHYQDYRDYPMSVSPDLTDLEKLGIDEFLARELEIYSNLVDNGLPPEEARQILSNAATTNFLWTINARSLVEFLNKRLCERNVQEMRIFARRLHMICNTWFPELFKHVGPQCKMLGVCKQGKMKALKCIEGGRGNG